MLALAAEVPLGHGDALGMLLSVEGFLFAAIALSATLAEPNKDLPPRHPRLKPELILMGAAWSLVAIGLGAGVAWSGVYVGGSYQGFMRLLEGTFILIAVVAQPVLAFLLAMSARRA